MELAAILTCNAQVATNPPWFLALVWGELLLQLPFFFVASYAFIYQKKWIRIPALVRLCVVEVVMHAHFQVKHGEVRYP